LSFVRHGNARAKVEVTAMSSGETRMLRMPPAVCTGVVRSSLEIDALGGNAPSGAMPGKVGDYDLRC
ncbi:MAG TPA: hypothetical protein VE968_02420, partial [Sphingomicrobium sp.]|nr:hypothetical protein [Sphingomicrobium sp.]